MRRFAQFPTVLIGFLLASGMAAAQVQGDKMAAIQPEPPAVTVLGLGNMGSALARTLIAKGVRVTVWNRTAAKAAPLKAAGARVALSPAEAIAASPLTVICTIDKAATAGLLQGEGVSAALRGRTIAELSTGTPAEARANAKLVSTAGGRYLDGGIMGYPRDIGRADGLIVYSGNRSAFDEYGPTLATMAGAQRYLGEDEGAAATVYLALWAYYFPAVSSFFEGAALAQTAGVSLVDFQKLAAIMNNKLEDGLDDSVRRIAAHNYAGDQAPVDTYVEGLYIVRNAFLAKHLNHVSVDAFINHLEQIQRAGDGDKDIAILFRTLGGKD